MKFTYQIIRSRANSSDMDHEISQYVREWTGLSLRRLRDLSGKGETHGEYQLIDGYDHWELMDTDGNRLVNVWDFKEDMFTLTLTCDIAPTRAIWQEVS